MFCKLLITIVLLKTYTIKVIQSQYLDTEISYQKPKLEKNNIVNKGVWVRNKFSEDLLEKEGANNFIFRENSLDVDNLLQNNFDAFGGNYMQDIPFVSAYAERQKRSSSYWNKRPRKSITGKNLKTRLSRQNNEFENVDSSQLKVINDLQPSSVFNEYPYEVAILSNNNITQDIGNNETVESTTQNPNINDIIVEPTIKSIGTEIKNTSHESNKNISSPKRSMKYDFETEIIKKIEFTEDLNKTENNNDNKVIDRSNVFDKDNSEWHQNAPIPDVNMYKVVPKEPMQKSKPVTERGLLKVISMLTKTFKKIIKEHNEIKEIHNSVTEITEEFKKNTALFASKFQDFDLKYLYLLKFHDKMKEFDEKLASREDYFLNKEKDMAKNFKEFENQQKKFLIQQKQFYNIQKLMLAQNEKINSKQNLIAKTQSEISHRQNNFARILKKAKQLYTDRNPAITKLSSTITKLKDSTPKTLEQAHVQISTQAPDITTESVKINLFSIPASNKLRKDPDELLLKEKDDQAIDDLVYKYYFNNTFIDSFMRSKILNSFMGNGENGGNTSSAKHKRNNLETTILLPVLENNESEIYGHKRERRWINRHRSRHSKRRRDRKTTPVYIINTTDNISEKPVNVGIPLNNIVIEPIKDNVKRDPFLIMAASFCNEIHQNSNQQTLRWCIEKALRRLKFLETGMMPKPAQPKTTASTLRPLLPNMKNSMDDKQMLLLNMIPPHINMDGKMPTSEVLSTTKEAPSVTNAALQASDSTPPPIQLTPLTLQTVSIPYTNQPPPMKMSSEAWAFPDNDELELKIKEYDLTPDTEGNVYYEGSIHASDIVADSESGVDDIMPGLDSNSRVEVDPMTFDLQAKRRASVRKLNERIRSSLL